MAKAKVDSPHRVVISGEMNISQAAELKPQLIDPIRQHKTVEIDLSQVTEIDASGLQLMIVAKIEANFRQCQLSFTGHSRAVQELLDLSQLASFFGDPVVIQSQA